MNRTELEHINVRAPVQLMADNFDFNSRLESQEQAYAMPPLLTPSPSIAERAKHQPPAHVCQSLLKYLKETLMERVTLL